MVVYQRQMWDGEHGKAVYLPCRATVPNQNTRRSSGTVFIFLSPAACYLTGNSCCFPPAGQAALASSWHALLGNFSGTMSTVQPVTYQGEMLQGTRAISTLPPHSSVTQLHGSTGSFPGPHPQEKTTTAGTRCARWQLMLLPAWVQAGVFHEMSHL